MADGWGSGDSPGGWDAVDGAAGHDWGTQHGSDAWGGDPVPIDFTVPRAASVLPLALGIVAGVIGVGLSTLATPTSIIAPLIGWVLCAVVAVLLVAAFQVSDLTRASETAAYRSAPGAKALRTVALLVATVGIVANSVAIAAWVATR